MNNIKYENEITVEVAVSYKKLQEILLNEGFSLTEEIDYIDIYMLSNECKKTKPLEILQNCIILRNVVNENQNIKSLVYKIKEYNKNNEIIKQSQVKCNVDSLEDAQQFFEKIGYHNLIKIVDKIKIYSKGKTNFAVQLVNDKHVYIEFEQDENFKTIDELKNEFNKYDIPIIGNNYFVKKAEIELVEIMNGKIS